LVEIAAILKKDVDEADILSERMDAPGLPRWNVVRHFFQDAALGPAATALMIDSFDQAMERFGGVPGKSCMDAMAGRVVEAARSGERDAGRLAEAALRGLHPERPRLPARK
jgi:hypothetical protein